MPLSLGWNWTTGLIIFLVIAVICSLVAVGWFVSPIIAGGIGGGLALISGGVAVYYMRDNTYDRYADGQNTVKLDHQLKTADTKLEKSVLDLSVHFDETHNTLKSSPVDKPFDLNDYKTADTKLEPDAQDKSFSDAPPIPNTLEALRLAYQATDLAEYDPEQEALAARYEAEQEAEPKLLAINAVANNTANNTVARAVAQTPLHIDMSNYAPGDDMSKIIQSKKDLLKKYYIQSKDVVEFEKIANYIVKIKNDALVQLQAAPESSSRSKDTKWEAIKTHGNKSNIKTIIKNYKLHDFINSVYQHITEDKYLPSEYSENSEYSEYSENSKHSEYSEYSENSENSKHSENSAKYYSMNDIDSRIVTDDEYYIIMKYICDYLRDVIGNKKPDSSEAKENLEKYSDTSQIKVYNIYDHLVEHLITLLDDEITTWNNNYGWKGDYVTLIQSGVATAAYATAGLTQPQHLLYVQFIKKLAERAHATYNSLVSLHGSEIKDINQLRLALSNQINTNKSSSTPHAANELARLNKENTQNNRREMDLYEKQYLHLIDIMYPDLLDLYTGGSYVIYSIALNNVYKTLVQLAGRASPYFCVPYDPSLTLTLTQLEINDQETQRRNKKHIKPAIISEYLNKILHGRLHGCIVRRQFHHNQKLSDINDFEYSNSE